MTSTITRTLPPSHPSPPLNLLPTPTPTPTPTTLTLTQHASTLSSDTYTLALPSGEALYTTTSSPANKKWTSHRTFLDAGGQPVFDLRCANGKPLRWSVGLPGREDCDNDEALATLQWSHVIGQERVEVLLGEGQGRKLVGRKEKGLGGEAAEGRRASSKDVVVFDGEEAVVRTRIVGNGLKARVPFRDNEWEVGVGEGVDVALAAAIAVFLAITLCEKPAISKSQMLVGMLLPTGGGFAMGAGAGGFGGSAVGGGGGGDGGGGGGGGGC